MADTPLTLAETASIFCETLLFERAAEQGGLTGGGVVFDEKDRILPGHVAWARALPDTRIALQASKVNMTVLSFGAR